VKYVKYTVIQKREQAERIKLGKNTFRCYSPKQMEKRYPNDDYIIIGEVKNGSKKKKIGKLDNGHPVSKRGTHSALFSRKAGYICVDEDTYIVVLRPRLLPWLLLGLVVLALGAVLLLRTSSRSAAEVPQAQGDFQVGGKIERVEEESAPKPSGGSITFSGYKKVTVSEKNPYVELTNPAENSVDFVFTLTDKATGQVLAVTERVPPGQYAYVDVWEHFRGTSGGVLILNIATFTADNQPLSGVDSEVEIEIKE